MEGIFRIKEILKEKGMSSEKLAELIGMSPVSLSYIVNGKKNTGVKTLVEIASALDVEVKDLFHPAPAEHTATDVPANMTDNHDQEEPIFIRKGDSFERIGSIKMNR